MRVMSDISQPVDGPLVRLVVRVAGALAQGLRHLHRAYRNRSDATALASLDDRMLADMGLTRSDVRDAFAEPLWHDPTSLLRARALERRLARRHVSLGLKMPRARPPGAKDDFARPAIERPSRLAV